MGDVPCPSQEMSFNYAYPDKKRDAYGDKLRTWGFILAECLTVDAICVMSS